MDLSSASREPSKENRRMNNVHVNVVLLGCGVLAGCATDQPDTAQFESAHNGPVVIASGLDNPRGLNFGPDGALYLAEAGRGGTDACGPGPLGGDMCLGPSGAITRISGRSRERIITGLASFASPGAGGQAFGPSDVQFTPRGDGYFVVQGCILPSNTCGRLFQIGPRNRFHQVADLGAFEIAHDPAGLHPGESDPYGVLALDHQRVIADAAANDLLSVSDTGAISVLAVFPERTVSGLQMDPVPTAVLQASDGSFIVGELTGAPLPVGGARLYRVVPGRAPTVIADGFTNIIDLAEAPDGSILVLEIAKNSLASGDPSGALIRVNRDGSRRTIVDQGLSSPTAVAVGDDGDLFISNHGQEAGVGEVLRIHPGR
jgi:DNA-binding beta-propeller fold protein YncE